MKEFLQIVKTLPLDTTVTLIRSVSLDKEGATCVIVTRSLPGGAKIVNRHLYSDALVDFATFPLELIFKDQLNTVEKEHGKLTAN